MLKKIVINSTGEDIIIESGLRKEIRATKETIEWLEKYHSESVANIQQCKKQIETAENLIKRLYES